MTKRVLYWLYELFRCLETCKGPAKHQCRRLFLHHGKCDFGFVCTMDVRDLAIETRRRLDYGN